MTEVSDTLTLAGIFLMGLGLNLTPCVYPMISVTAALFGKDQQTSRARAFLKAFVYVLGIATMYSSLGVFAALTGGLFGTLMQNRWELLGISLLLAGLALSMLGVYTFQLPSWLVQKASGKKLAGLFGIFLSGLVVGVFAAPCIGPPIIALLTFAGTKGDPFFAFQTFFVMSLGLGMPYLFLGTFSSLLNRLPKSGIWLIWVERLFGVILLTMASFYLILALNPEWLSWLPVIALVFGGLYLGFIENEASYGPKFRNFKKAVGILAVGLGILFPFMTPRQGVTWEPFSFEKLAEAQFTGRPVILDFYADWCIPCHELDRFTYTDPEVVQKLSSFSRFKVDMTNPEGPEFQTMTEQFEIMGVPTIIFIGADGQELKEARITGFISAKEMRGYLQCVQDFWTKGNPFEKCVGSVKE